MVFVAYLLENAILVLSRSEVFAHFFKPTVRCLLKTPAPQWAICRFSKMPQGDGNAWN